MTPYASTYDKPSIIITALSGDDIPESVCSGGYVYIAVSDRTLQLPTAKDGMKVKIIADYPVTFDLITLEVGEYEMHTVGDRWFLSN
tara:strand:+ start:31 stop:291 length:261 start_codon:yes stop_codon:yes gene_type:complete